MAKIDSTLYFDCRTVLDKTKYSNFRLNMKNLADYGEGRRVYACVQFLGTYDTASVTHLTVDLMGCTNDDMSDGFVISSTGAIPKGNINADLRHYLPLPPTGKKYKYIYLKYTLTGGTEESGVAKVDLCPVEPVLNGQGELKNGVTAYVTDIAAFDTQYIKG